MKENRSKRRNAFLLVFGCLVIGVSCAIFSWPWNMPRPEVIDKPQTITASASLPPTPTADLSCWTDWKTYPTPVYASSGDIPSPVEPLILPEEVKVLALLGTDRNSPFVGRTDAILLAFYHPRLARVSLVSLPPDLFLFIPGYSMQRLQVSYAVGGAEGFARTLEYNFGFCLDNFLLVHLDDFVAFVDDIGGLYVDVLDGHPKACGGIAPGHVWMNGDQLLCYASYRIGDGELERNLRQQEVARLLYQRIVQGGSLVLLPEWIDRYWDSLETSLDAADLLEMIPLALRLGDTNRMGFFRFSSRDLIPWELSGDLASSVFLPDREGMQLVLQDAVDFVLQAEPPSELVVTLAYELTVSPTATTTPTTTTTGTRTITPTATLTPVRAPTRTRTPTITRTPTRTPGTTQTPPPERIAFSADGNGDGSLDVLTMAKDGSSIAAVVQTAQDALVWDWSVNGDLVFERGAQVFLIAADGIGETAVPGLPPGNNSQFAWSPDGSWLLFRNDNGQPDLYIIHRDGSGLRQLTDDAADDREPDWSPDGNQVVFVSDRDGNPEIYVLSAAHLTASTPTPTPVPSLPITRLTNTAGFEASPHYSPDGSLLVYARQDGGQWDIYTGSASDLQAPDRLTNDAVPDSMPSWSRDGANIVFVHGGEIYLMAPDGGGLRLVDNGITGEANPVWQP